MREVQFCGPAALAALLAAATPCLAAAPPAGIAIAVTGKTDPPLSAMTEIPADTPIRLGNGAEVRFLHYARCQLVTVVDGTLTLSRSDYKTDGHIESERNAPCPHVYTVNEPASAARTTGGLILRGGPGTPHWAVNSLFLLTGPRADTVRTAAIYAEDRPDAPVLTLAVKGGRATAPPGTPPLLPNRRYQLRLTVGGQAKPVVVGFVGVAPSGTASLVVLRVD
ncbi:MAG TPA: hypothetical protein VJ770_02745 [Stellaceae bacterium]|nr:hypothetical protein [Stellaceae bacterium]